MGGPYASNIAIIGGVPTVGVDVPICAIFIVLFLISAVSHMAILEKNRRRNHKFTIQRLLFGYCMARTVTCIMRIVWATRPHDIRIALAANIFSNAGVFIAYLFNLIIAQRIFCAAFIHVGATKAFKLSFAALYVLVGLTLAAVITSVIQGSYTLDTYILQVDRDIQLTAIILILVLAALPLPLTLAAMIHARRVPPRPFGAGSWNAKVSVLIVTTLLALTVAGFRCGTAWMAPHPKTNPYWFDARWCYYFFNFVFDLAIIDTYLFTRVDKRFYLLGETDLETGAYEKDGDTKTPLADVIG